MSRRSASLSRAGVSLAAWVVLASATATPAVGAPQSATSSLLPGTPVLITKGTEEQRSEMLAVGSADVQVVIAGFLARTTTTLTFQNSADRILEGELVFPLPEGATLSGYGLDVEGQIVDAVVVEAQAARVAFESEVRQGIDPGLVEWVRGSSFRTRVWPIPAHGRRTVRVEYVSELARGADGVAVYQLPLRYSLPIPELALRIEVVDPSARPTVHSSRLANFSFAAWDGRLVASARLENQALSEDLRITIPLLEDAAVLVEAHSDGRTYFALDDLVALPVPPAAARPRRVGLLWDASLSHAASDVRRELEVITAWLVSLRDVEVVLTVFRNVAEPPRMLAVRGGDPAPVLAAIQREPCDGGTSLESLKPIPGVDHYVLVSDGVTNVGRRLPEGLGAPIYALTASARADHALLRHLAHRSGGQYIPLATLTPEEAAARIGRPLAGTVSLGYDRAALTDVLPAESAPVEGRVTVTGRLLAPEARLTLRYTMPAGATREKHLTVRRSATAASGLVARFWAGRKAAELLVAPDRNRDALVALGKAFGIVTPGTSLLVLETLDQHLRHGIEPPATRAELRTEYRRRMEERTASQTRTRDENIERVVEMWSERIAWWETAWKGRPKPAPVAASLPPPPPPAPPPPNPSALTEPSTSRREPAGVTETIEVKAEGPYETITVHASSVAAESESLSEGAAIEIKPWDPDRPYLAAIKKAGPRDAYAAYLAERDRYAASPAFYLDGAEHFLAAGDRAIGLRVLTAVLDLGLDEPRLLRVVGHRVQQLGELNLAVTLFEQVLRLRPEEPQSLRDLALAVGARADAARAERRDPAHIAADYLRALDLLERLVAGEWDERFPGIELVALMDANRMLAIMERERLPGLERVTLDRRLRRLLDVDVRIVLTWDADLTDLDLWITEPTGEKCNYSNERTAIGGLISDDFTNGYGPEEYLLRRARTGEYRVQADFYGSRAQSLTGPTTAQATVITDFGRPHERRRTLTVRLTDEEEAVDIGSVRFEAKRR